LKTTKSAWANLPSFRKIREAMEAESPDQTHKPNFFKCLVLYTLVSGAYVFHALSSVNRSGRKIARQLASYSEGSYLHLFFKDQSDCFGYVGPLSVTTFAFTEATTNSVSQIPYNDIASVAIAVPSADMKGSSKYRPLLSWTLLAIVTAASIGVTLTSGN
jgi:hypothetical protein